jgi:hypothetical protein
MFNQINGLPTHILALHAAVVLVPLAALLGVVFAVPRTRAWSRAPLLIIAVVAVGAVFLARLTGQHFQRVLIAHQVLSAQSPATDLIRVHAQRANVLLYATIGYAALAAVAVFVSRPGTGSGVLTTLVAVVMVLAAAGLTFQVYRVGDIGARAVWNPTGQVDYGSTGGGG